MEGTPLPTPHPTRHQPTFGACHASPQNSSQIHAYECAGCLGSCIRALTKAYGGRITVDVFVLMWPWPWPDDLRIRTWSALFGGTPDMQTWTSYVKAFESYRVTDIHTYKQTDRQTEAFEIIYHATLRAVKN